MARIRSMKPEGFQDEKLAPLPVIDRFVWLGLISMADDCGRLLDNLKVIDAFIFPESADSARESLAKLSGLGRIQRGMTASGQRVIQIVNWEKHQKVDHPNLKAALPEIVVPQGADDIREANARAARGKREKPATDSRLIPTTNDQRSTTSTDVPAAPVVGLPGGWTGEASRLWLEHVGSVKVGRLGAALKPLVDTYGWDTPLGTGPPVKPVLVCYCKWAGYKDRRTGRLPDKADEAVRDLTFVKPENFAATYQEWAEYLKPMVSA